MNSAIACSRYLLANALPIATAIGYIHGSQPIAVVGTAHSMCPLFNDSKILDVAPVVIHTTPEGHLQEENLHIDNQP